MTPATPPQDLSDIEIVRACARAMGLKVSESHGSLFYMAGFAPVYDGEGTDCSGIEISLEYDPLTDKSQSMELVIALKLTIDVGGVMGTGWLVRHYGAGIFAHEKDLLRAICLCAARIQLSKESK